MASVDIILNAVDNTKGAMNSAASGIDKVKSAAGSASAAFGMVTMAVGAVMAAVTKAATSFTAYSDQVKAVARVTGTSAEESSKLIQVTDDLFISYESLSVAMKMAVKQGIEPNMESLAKLSDTYMGLAPGLERSTFLLDNFGKSGLEMGKMMEVGAAGLRAMSDAVPEGLILSDADVAQADSLKIAFDNLGDTITAFALKLTTDAAPGILKFINGITTLVAKMDESYDVWGNNAAQLKIYTEATSANNAIKERAIKLWIEESGAIGKNAEAFETLLTPAQQDALLTAADMELNHNTAAGAMDAMGMGADTAAEAIKKLNEEQGMSGPRIENVTEVLTEEEQKLLDVAEAAKAAAISTANIGMVSSIMSAQGAYDTLTAAADAFATKQAEVDALMAGPKTWMKMEGGWELSAVPQETLDSLEELRGKFDEARAASERWIKEFIFSMVQAKLSAGGLDDIEFTQLLQVGQGLGLIDPAVAATTQAVVDAINSTDPAGIDQAVAGLSELFGYGGQPIVITPIVAPPVTASAYAQTTAAVTTAAPTAAAPTAAAPTAAAPTTAAPTTTVPQETIDSYNSLESSINNARVANEKWIKQFITAQAQMKLESKPVEASDAKLKTISDTSAQLGAIEPDVASTIQMAMDAISNVNVYGLDQALIDMKRLFTYDGKEINIQVNAAIPPPPGAPPPGELNAPALAGEMELNIPTGYYNIPAESDIPIGHYDTPIESDIPTGYYNVPVESDIPVGHYDTPIESDIPVGSYDVPVESDIPTGYYNVPAENDIPIGSYAIPREDELNIQPLPAIENFVNQINIAGLDMAMEDMKQLFAYDGKEIQVAINASTLPVFAQPENAGAGVPDLSSGNFNVPLGYSGATNYIQNNERTFATTEQAEGGKGVTNNYYIDRATFMLERGAEGEILARLTE
jgi:hypothetical protein